jgi:hypothetical protein
MVAAASGNQVSRAPLVAGVVDAQHLAQEPQILMRVLTDISSSMRVYRSGPAVHVDMNLHKDKKRRELKSPSASIVMS